MNVYFASFMTLLKKSGRNRVEIGKKPDINPFGFNPVRYGFYLVSNLILRDLSGSIRSLSEKWLQKISCMNILPGLNRASGHPSLPGIWNQKLKYKNMFLSGSYLVSIRQLSTCKLLRWKYICYPALPGSYLAYGTRS